MEEKVSMNSVMESMTPEQQMYVKGLLGRNQQLTMMVQQLQDQIGFKKLDYLFKVVELGVFDDSFTTMCAKEIQEIMFGSPEDPQPVEDPKPGAEE